MERLLGGSPKRPARTNRIRRPLRTPGIGIVVDTAPGERQLREEALVARLAAGEHGEPLSALYAAYGRQIYGLGVHLLRDAGMAEELVQETFVRLWRSAYRYDAARSSVRTFVFTLARRAAVDLWRRRGAPVAAVLDEPQEEDVAGTEAFEHVLERLEMGEALATLSPAHRNVLELQYHEDLTQAQAAERLAIPLGTVKTRTMHALRALARHHEEQPRD